MPDTDEFRLRAAELVSAGRYLHERGWLPATSGNLSARLGDGRVAITVSGRHKGRLTADDIMAVDAAGRSPDGRKPSAETRLHTMLYARDAAIGAVVHAHSPGAVLASRVFGERIVLTDHELLKALRGVDTHAARITVPIFPNDQDIERLASLVGSHFDTHGAGYGYIIAGHGFYTWGESVDEALRHAEALEFLFDIEFRLYGVTTP
jgi:methylthioribulose-1-phosphate dehydratase